MITLEEKIASARYERKRIERLARRIVLEQDVKTMLADLVVESERKQNEMLQQTRIRFDRLFDQIGCVRVET